jgi:hypothetical protein
MTRRPSHAVLMALEARVVRFLGPNPILGALEGEFLWHEYVNATAATRLVKQQRHSHPIVSTNADQRFRLSRMVSLAF